jgi:hypothetical protein
MGKSGARWPSRLITVLVVLTLHSAILILLLAAHPDPLPAVPQRPPLELLYLPPVKAPKMLAASTPPKHLVADVGLSLAPPSIDGLLPAAPVAQAGGGGAGVNWAAEARRALIAYEIRRDHGVEHATLGLTPWDGWLPPWQRRPGERVRTPSGDWIVWINGSCYEVASWHPGTPARLAAQTPTICVDDPNAPPDPQPATPLAAAPDDAPARPPAHCRRA